MENYIDADMSMAVNCELFTENGTWEGFIHISHFTNVNILVTRLFFF